MHIESETNPAEALRLVEETQRAAAARVRAPGWYHPAVGATNAVIIASLEGGSFMPLTAIGCAFLTIIITQYQKQTGVWLYSLAGGRRSDRVAYGGLVIVILGIAAGLWLKHGEGLDGAMVVTAILLGLFTTFFGRVWERTYLRENGVEA